MCYNSNPCDTSQNNEFVSSSPTSRQSKGWQQRAIRLLNRLGIQGLVRLLERIDLILACLDALLIADLDLNALWLEHLKVVVCLGQLLVDADQHLLRATDLKFFLVLFQLGLDLGLVLVLLVGLGILHEAVILGSAHGLCGFGLCLETDKVTDNHLKHAHDTALSGLHAAI